jgi:DNA-binding transcriptional LysR family regulator
MGYPGHRDGPAARDKQLFARHARPLPDNRIEVPSWLIVRQLVLENDFIAALPGLIELYEPNLRALPISFEPIEHSVGITTAAGRALSSAANALIQRLRTMATQRLHDESEDDIYLASNVRISVNI